MIRGVCTGIAALSLMTGVALAQDAPYHHDDSAVTVYHNPVKHTVRGGLAGAGAGALIGCLVTIPIGCAPGAAVGAAVGGGTGAVVGAASTPPPRTYYPARDYPPAD